LAAGDYDKLVLLSDDAFPLADITRLRRFFDQDIDHITVAKMLPGSEFHDRYANFFYYDHPATMVRYRGARPPYMDDLFSGKMAEVAAIKLIGKKRLDVYHGSQFWALRRDTVLRIIKIMEDDTHLAKSFEFAALPDELCVQSIVGNYMPDVKRLDAPLYADFQ